MRLTDEQLYLLNTLRNTRRAAVVGGAGTGKTMLAIAKAKQLASEGFDTLLVCFNSPLARLLFDETLDVAGRTRHLQVRTFHQLAEDLGREAGVLPPKPEPVTAEWFERTLPDGLDAAIERLGPRYHAIVVDEGQDFDGGWLASLEGLLHGGREDVLYVFHDPAQSIFRDDQTGELGLTEFPLDFNCRNAKPIHDLIVPLARGGLGILARRRDGRPVELITAEGDAQTIEALRVVLHRLVTDEGVAPGSIAVLTGLGLEHSAVWAPPPLRQPGALERRGRRCRAAARAGRRGRPGAAEGRRPVRLDPPVQGPGAAGRRVPRGAAGRPGAAGSVAVHRGLAGHATPRCDRAAGRRTAAVDAFDVTASAKAIRVDWVDLRQAPALAASPGRLGMTFLPGKDEGSGGSHHRDLDRDVERLRDVYSVDTVVLLVEDHELERLRVPDIAEEMEAHGIDLVRHPIPDGSFPADRVALRATVDGLLARLANGENVVVACRGGLGRTGTVVGCLLRDCGLDGDDAIALTRASRPGTIETDEQERFVASWGE